MSAARATRTASGKLRQSLAPSRAIGKRNRTSVETDIPTSMTTNPPKPNKRSKPSNTTVTATADSDTLLFHRKHNAWQPYLHASPFPTFGHPTARECEIAHDALAKLHQADVEKEFTDENTPETIPHVLDAMIVAVLSQATGWSNAKRAMKSMKATYGSIFAYDEISAGGREKLAETIKCGGLHQRKSMIIMSILQDAKKRHGSWDLDDMFNMDDEEAMKELLSYKYVGTKSASVVMGWCLKRNPFTVDTHVYRISGLWGWPPETASREKTQSHLEVMIPPKYKFALHFLLIQHGRACPGCRGGSKGKECILGKQLQ